MILTKLTASDGTVSYSEVGEDTLMGNLVDGLKAPFLGEDEYLSSSAAFWGTVTYSVVSSAASSVIARRRQAAGQKPMAKVFF